jgi:hypothetical protein
VAAQVANPAISSETSRPARGESAPGSAPSHAASLAGPRGNAYGYYAKLQGEHVRAQLAQDQRLDQAVGMRQAQQALASAEEILAAAEDALGGIVKRYPPYAPNSPERVQLLNQVSGLKKQIEALNFPPEAAEKAEKLDPVLKELLGLVEELPAAIPDEALAALLEKVETAKATVAEQRDVMWSDLFGPDREQAAMAQAKQSQADLANMELPLSQSPDVLTNLA